MAACKPARGVTSTPAWVLEALPVAAVVKQVVVEIQIITLIK